MDEKAIHRFVFSTEFKRLQNLGRRFCLFQALGVQRRELSHSDFLAYFLDPSQPHNCGHSVLRGFLHAACQETVGKEKEFQRLRLEDIAQIRDYRQPRVWRELEYIDLVIEFPESGVVFGIENKIDHIEGDQQLSRYQKVLDSRFRNPPYKVRVLFFLTPEGREADTVNEGSDIKCVPISYSCVAEGLSDGVSCCTDDDIKCILKGAIRHVREDLMNEGPEKDLVRILWNNKEYVGTFAEILRHRPKLDDIKINWKDKVTNYVKNELKDEPIWNEYPKVGELSEIDLFIKSWTAKGLHFALKLYYSGFNGIENRGLNPPAFRVLLQADLLDKNKDIYESFSDMDPEVVDREYPKLSSWPGWRRVLKEAEYPEDSFTKDFSFSDAMVNQAFKMLKDKVELLKPLVEKFTS